MDFLMDSLSIDQSKNQIESYLRNYISDVENIEFMHEKLNILDQSFEISGISLTTNDSSHIYASASSLQKDSLKIAVFECLERYVALKAEVSQKNINGCKFSISNGVAIHQNSSYAFINAKNEFIERNEILKSWYFNTKIKELKDIEKDWFTSAFREKFDIKVFNFSTLDKFFVLGIFAFPKTSQHNLIYGFGASDLFETALKKANNEFNTRLGFLWNEKPDLDGIDPSSPLYHQDFYLIEDNFKYIHEWLFGRNKIGRAVNMYDCKKLIKTDLTPKHWKPKLNVIKVFFNDGIPLFFGKAPENEFGFMHRCDIPHPMI
jgi:hypothetical protein